MAELINAEPDLEACGEADSVPQAWMVVEATAFDLVVVDLALRESRGLDLIKNLRAFGARTSRHAIQPPHKAIVGR